ncbi:MAG: ABC transporter permease [Desulfitobacteriaceae bacterium]|nr:ABC transporter permease [Desulfitobacteriaceae bacterium]MDI6880221.1 ABC transporter permease [Desulfitobacteriaceae bacterium]MDI6913075.1 ABC transporter permease [Desulfitobacteriaceae bacterium]
MMHQKASAQARGYLWAALFLWFVWELAARRLETPMLPTPEMAFTATLRLLQGNLGEHFWVSTYRVLLSLALSLLFGVPFGLVMGFEPKVDRVLAPLVYITYPIPKIVFLPLILLLLGLGDLSKVFLITLIVFFQILVTTRDAARKIPPETISSFLSLGAKRVQVYRYVLLPASLPDVFTALRLSMGTAVAVLFFAESFATTKGLGYFIMDAWSRSAPDEMFAGILAMGVLGVALFILTDVMDHVFIRWQHVQR